MPEISRIDDFLAASLRAEAPAWPQEWSSDDAAGKVCDRIDAHGIALVLAQQADGIDQWPAAIRETFLKQARMQAFWEESHRRQLQTILERLADRGIRILVMKGTALAYSAYPDPAMRRRGDSDLLVRSENVPAMREVLQSLGLELVEQAVGVVFQEAWRARSNDGLTHDFDVHWRVADSPLLQRVLTEEALFADAIPLPALGQHGFAPGPVHGFVQGSLNQCWHEFSGYHRGAEGLHQGVRLIWALDNRLQAERFTARDWDRLVAFANDTETAPVILRSLQAAHSLLGAEVPARVLAKLASAGEGSVVFEYLTKPDNAARFRANLWAARGLGTKLAYVRGNLFATAGHLRTKFPDAVHWPIFALQLRRLAGNFCKVLGREAR